jgi:hypothetical protein
MLTAVNERLDEFFTFLERRRLPPLLVAIICVSVFFANWLTPLVLSPDSYTYIRWAETLVSLQFDYITYFRSHDFFTPSYFYTIPVSVIASLQVAFTDAWLQAFHILNSLLIAASILASYLSLRALSVRPTIAALGLFSSFFCIDFFIWPHYLLSDTLFVFFASLTLLALSPSGWNQTRAYYSIALILLLFFCRPSSLPYCAVGLAVVSGRTWKLGAHIDRFRFVISGVALVVIGSAFFVSLVNIGLKHPGISAQIDFITTLAKAGTVIHDRPDTFVAEPSNNYELCVLYLHRLIMFWGPYLSAFSLPHNVLNITFATTLCVGLFVGWYSMQNMDERVRTAFFAILILCIAVGCFQALTIIDYDWRYRYPLQLPLLVCALVGIDSLLKSGSCSKQTHTEIP